jgi:membrane-associated PAP2 superfamily phosphatase
MPTSRQWRFDAAVAACAAAVVTGVFANGQLDLALTGPFFDAGSGEHWPLGQQMPWSLLYSSSSWITASLVLGGLLFLAVALVRHKPLLQRQAIFVILSMLLGPGLLVNAVFKDHWDRPRPRDVIELGGSLHYAPAPLRGEGGKSFPCGHCSVGFLYAVGAWLWRRRLRWAIASAATGLSLGTAMGVGRMAAGGHFPSDIAWSAFISLSIAHWLYWYVLRIPAHEAGEPPSSSRRLPRYTLALLAVLGAISILSALFVTAHGERIDTAIRLDSLPMQPQEFVVSARYSDVDIVVVDSGAAVRVHGETHGFGLPGSRLVASPEFTTTPVPTLRYSIEQRGRFTDLDCRISLEIPAANLQAITVHVEKGNILIRDRTQGRVLKSGKVRVDMRTGAGRAKLSE